MRCGTGAGTALLAVTLAAVAVAAVASPGPDEVAQESADDTGWEEEPLLNDQQLRRKRSDDLQYHWYRRLYAWCQFLDLNISLMQYKMYYIGLDIDYANGTLFNIKADTKYVNGTRVNWDKHPPTWIPTFKTENSSGDAKVSKMGVGVGAESAVDVEHMSANGLAMQISRLSRRRRTSHAKSIMHMPPRARRIQLVLIAEQKRLDGLWSNNTAKMRQVIAIQKWMKEHEPKRTRPSAFLLELSSRDTLGLSSRNSSRNVTPSSKLDGSVVGPEDNMIEQVKSQAGQIEEIWDQFARLGHMTEALKFRVKRHKRRARKAAGGGASSRRRRRRRRSAALTASNPDVL